MTEHNRYIEQSDVEAELPFDNRSFGLDDTEWNDVIQRHMGAASDDIEKWTDTVFNTATVTSSVSRPHAVDKYDLPLPERPVQSVTSVDINGDQLTEGTDYTVHETHLELLPDSSFGSWPTSRRSVTVEWTYGFAEAPPAIQAAVIRLVRSSLDQIKTDGLGNESLPDGASYGYRPPADIRREVRSEVSEYSAPSYSGGTIVV